MNASSVHKCKVEGSLRCERVDVNFEAIKTEELLTIEGVEFKRAEARVEAQQHAGMYSFIASKTGGLAVFIIGDNEDNFTQGGLIKGDLFKEQMQVFFLVP